MIKVIALVLDLILLIQSVVITDTKNSLAKKYFSHEDVKYGVVEQQNLDVYIPKIKSGSEAGLVLYIHGGTWKRGGKESFRDNCIKLAKKGYAAATVNYRLVTQGASAHDMMNDLAAALKKIKSLASKDGVKINKVIPNGISAGAHLALLYAYTMKNKSPIKPVAVVAYCPPSDFVTDEMYTQSRLGSCKQMTDIISKLSGESFTYKQKDNYRISLEEISPYYNVNRNTVPTLLCHGKLDTAVSYQQSKRLSEKLKLYNVPHTFITFPNSAHHLDKDPEKRKLFRQCVNEYIFTYLN